MYIWNFYIQDKGTLRWSHLLLHKHFTLEQEIIKLPIQKVYVTLDHKLLVDGQGQPVI